MPRTYNKVLLCRQCGETNPLKFQSGAKGRCKKCRCTQQRAWYSRNKATCQAKHKAYHKKNGDKRRAGFRDRVHRNRKLWLDFIDTLIKQECVECGYSEYTCALDFHHRDPSTKSFAIANFTWQYSFTEHSKLKLATEIAKCDILCANCHRVLHYIEEK